MARYFSEGMYLNEAIVELQRAELCIPNDDRSVALLHQKFGAIYGERYAAWEQESDLNMFISSGQKAVTYEANLHDKCGVYVEMSQMLVTCHVPSIVLISYMDIFAHHRGCAPISSAPLEALARRHVRAKNDRHHRFPHTRNQNLVLY